MAGEKKKKKNYPRVNAIVFSSFSHTTAQTLAQINNVILRQQQFRSCWMGGNSLLLRQAKLECLDLLSLFVHFSPLILQLLVLVLSLLLQHPP